MTKYEIKNVAALLLISLLIKFLLSPVQGYKIDLSTYAAWFHTAAEYGPHLFYESAGWCDYPPFNVYIFWTFGSLAKSLSLFGTRFLVYIVKLPPNLFDAATAFMIFIFLRRRLDFKHSFMATSFYAFNPAAILNTSIWGQYDAIYTFFLILSLIFILRSKPKLSVIAFTVAILTKPQSIALAPLILFLIVRKHGWKNLVTSILALAFTTLVIIIPFKWSNPVDFLVDIYLGGYGGYPYTSINAFNIWAFGGFWKSDAQVFIFLDFFTIGWIMFGTLTAFSLYSLNRRFEDSEEIPVLLSAFILLFGFFMLPTRIHERYLFPVLSVMSLMWPLRKEIRRVYWILTFTCFTNQAYVLYFLNNDRFIPDWDVVVWTITLINLLTFLYALVLIFRRLKAKTWFSLNSIRTLKDAIIGGPKHMQIDKRDLATIITLSLVFFLIATWNLGLADAPLTTWQASGNKSFYIDLGSMERVNAVYVLIKSGYANLQVYSGYSWNWSESGKASMYDYYRWYKIDINSETQFIKFVFQHSSGEIVEIAVLDEDKQKITINSIRGENDDDPTLGRLIDEQEKAECPPTCMSETYFDEIYYVRTAENYIKLEEPYEWTHPPLGKLVLAAGVLAFGYSPFGWRIIGVLFATLMIPVIYFFGKKMFGTWIGAFAPAFLLMFDFMHFTMGRIATVDTFAVFFSLASQLFFLIYFQNVLRDGWETSVVPLFLAVLFFSLGFSTKWYVLYGFAGQLFLLLVLRFRDLLTFKGRLVAKIRIFFGHPFFIVLGFIAIAAVVYLLTFVPNMVIGDTLKDVYETQWSMYFYHSTLMADHPYASQWWSWPIILRPVWLYVSELPGGLVSTIAAMGNPAVWWVGFSSMLSAIVKAFKEKDHTCSFIAVIFLFQWLPYILIQRCTFLYHFYVNVPLLCLATAYFLNEAWSGRRGKIIGLAYLIGVIVLFALFYPVTSGYPMPYWWREDLRWFKSWGF